MGKTRLEKYGMISNLLSERGRGRVLLILETFALKGHFTLWELTKTVIRDRDLKEPSYALTQSEYGTFRKAVIKLSDSGYVAQQGTVKHSTHKKEEPLPLYGLTTKGLMVTMVVSEKARQKWQDWARTALKDETLPPEMKKILSYFIEYGASQLLFLKFFIDPNEKLVLSTYNMDIVSADTFWNSCIENFILRFEEGRINPLKNLGSKDKEILTKIHKDPTMQKMRESCLDFLKEEYSRKLKKIQQYEKATIP